MTATVRDLTSPRVAAASGADEAAAWLRGRLAWEDRLAELEHREAAPPRLAADRHWARTA